jgi:sugar lactone lactonase YvrE
MSLARDIVDRIFFPDRDVHAIPVLDGGFSPNERLDGAPVLGAPLDAPDALAVDDRGTLYVSSGRRILSCSGADFEARRVVVECEDSVGALAWSARTGLVAGVAGRGLCAIGADGRVTGRLDQVGGEPIRCATAVAIAADGTVYLTDGSRHNLAQQWKLDLMQKRPPSGRLIACDADLGNARVIADHLDWPAGVVVTHDQRSVLVAESWTHRLTAFDRPSGRPRVAVKNFAGYPSRLSQASGGGYWLAFFALRTQLTEFILREHGFRTRMMTEVPEPLWAGPSLGGAFDPREPTQIGRIKKLGIQKPWAPPRSYGLVARLDAQGHAIESYHSRAAGQFHGVTGVVEHDGRVLAVSKGHGKLAELSRAQ